MKTKTSLFNLDQAGKSFKSIPVFSHFVYQGNDQVYKDNPLTSGEFYSPILQG